MIDEDNNLAHKKRVEQDIKMIGWRSWVVAVAMTFPMLPPPPPSLIKSRAHFIGSIKGASLFIQVDGRPMAC